MGIGKKVMVVDDDRDMRVMIVRILGDAGFEIVECDNGHTALSRMVSDAELPHAIVLDLQMPIMSGREFLRVMCSYVRLAHVPVIILTGVKEPIRESDPVVGYVTKPFEPSDLVALVTQATA